MKNIQFKKVHKRYNKGNLKIEIHKLKSYLYLETQKKNNIKILEYMIVIFLDV